MEIHKNNFIAGSLYKFRTRGKYSVLYGRANVNVKDNGEVSTVSVLHAVDSLESSALTAYHKEYFLSPVNIEDFTQVIDVYMESEYHLMVDKYAPQPVFGFPKNGWVKAPSTDLLHYIKAMVNFETSSLKPVGKNGIAWNGGSWWTIDRDSGKHEYTNGELSIYTKRVTPMPKEKLRVMCRVKIMPSIDVVATAQFRLENGTMHAHGPCDNNPFGLERGTTYKLIVTAKGYITLEDTVVISNSSKDKREILVALAKIGTMPQPDPEPKSIDATIKRHTNRKFDGSHLSIFGSTIGSISGLGNIGQCTKSLEELKLPLQANVRKVTLREKPKKSVPLQAKLIKIKSRINNH